MKAMTKPMVAIIGRPNVGKSSLFNRLIGRREAVVTDIPGTTRDRIFGDVAWDGLTFTLVDTGGLEPRPQDPLKEKVKAQVEMAVDEADLLIFVVDGDEGLIPMDEEISHWLRRLKKPLITAINKIDNPKREFSAVEFYRLGLGEPMLISAYHNLGIHDLMERTISLLPPAEPYEEDKGVPKLAILGRTNVGKSMLLNSILGQERAIVSEIAGTTRDSLDTHFSFDGQPLVLIDTAGIRRRGQIQKGVEKYSVLRAVRTIERCDIAFLVMDATELATAQDAHVSGYAMDAFKGIIAVINKWDLLPQKDGTEEQKAIWAVRRRFHFMPYVPICFTSALTGEGIPELLTQALDLYRERQRRVPSGQLRHALMDAMAAQAPPSTGGKKVQIRDIRQVDVNPPLFLLDVSDPQLVHFSYRRYLENHLRAAFDFRCTHLRLILKRGK